MTSRLRGPLAHEARERAQREDAPGTIARVPHRVGKLFGLLLSTVGRLQNALRLIKRVLHLGDPCLGVLDRVFLHDAPLHRGGRTSSARGHRGHASEAGPDSQQRSLKPAARAPDIRITTRPAGHDRKAQIPMSTIDQTTDTRAESAPPAEPRARAHVALELSLSEAEALRSWLLKPAHDGTTSLDDPLVSRALSRLGLAVDTLLATVNVRRELELAGLEVDQLSDEQVCDLGRRVAEAATPGNLRTFLPATSAPLASPTSKAIWFQASRTGDYPPMPTSGPPARQARWNRGIGMSRENVETAKRATSAFNRRDLDAFAGVTTSDFEWVPVFTARVGGGLHRARGHRPVPGRGRGDLGGVHPEPEEYRDLGRNVVGLGRLKTRGRGSGVPFESPLGRRVRLPRTEDRTRPNLSRPR